MSTRLQVVVQEEELARFECTARAKQLTLSEWVRQSLRKAEKEVSTASVESKLSAINGGCLHDYPAPDIDDMLAEIESGYATKHST